MSTQGPPADAKVAQAAALREIEAAQRRKRAVEMSLVSCLLGGMGGDGRVATRSTGDEISFEP